MYLIAISGMRTCTCTLFLHTWGAFANSHVVSSEQLSGLQENFLCFRFQELQDAQGISFCFSMTTTISSILRQYICCGKPVRIINAYSKYFKNDKIREMAPRPGFGPGSCGRQPHILGRTILPGQTNAPQQYTII